MKVVSYGIGNFESDIVVGRGRQGAIINYVSKKSRFLIVELMSNRKPETFNNETIESFKHISIEYLKVFISDNGKEFSRFKELEKKLKIKCYFETPYHSWERGKMKGTMDYLRRYFPKEIDFKILTKETVNKQFWL